MVVCAATRRRWFVCGAALALHVTHCTGQIVSNVKDCSSTDAGALATTETKCLLPRKNLNPDVRYFKITVGGAGADMVYTSLISPNNATCSGSQGNHICAAPQNNIVTYKAFSGQRCVPDEKNNNWADLSPRFSKSIIICKPCAAGDYWLGLRRHSEDMLCDLKLFTPKLSSSDTAATCSFDSSPPNSLIEGAAVCNKGLERVRPPDVCPFKHSCLPAFGCANMCVLGVCQDLLFLGAATLLGLLLATLLWSCILCYCRRSWRRKLREAEEKLKDMVSKSYNVEVEGTKDADSDTEEIPAFLPPTFFVRDRDD